MSAQPTESDTTGALHVALAAIVGERHVHTDGDALRVAAYDGLRDGRAALARVTEAPLPLAVVQPHSTEEVMELLAVARSAGVPVVTLGGGTGLMGGARSVQPGIVLDMARMHRVLDVSVEDRTARVQAGIVIAKLNDALEPHGLFCGHDPWTVPIATIGGTIGTNGLGYLGGKYGSVADQVLGLQVVLADGTVVETRAAQRSATGPHLRRLWAGAEGTLGVVCEVTLRVFPLPERRCLSSWTFASFEAGFGAVCEMMAIGLRPALLDYGAPPSGEALMHLGFEGFAEGAEAAEQRAVRLVTAHGGECEDQSVTREFWENRHVYPRRLRNWRSSEQHEPPAGSPGSSVFEYMHVYVPQSRVLGFLEEATARFAQAGVAVSEWGLWHSPELVSLVARRTTETPAVVAAFAEAHDDVLRMAQDAGGSMEYVHGVGLRLRHLMSREHGAGLEVLRRIKHALDPDDLLNPGKLGL